MQVAVTEMKAALDALEQRVRQRSKNTEAEVRQLASARKHASDKQDAGTRTRSAGTRSCAR